jgi:23S rRNA pseudouridine1911/1915/1917 synthase
MKKTSRKPGQRWRQQTSRPPRLSRELSIVYEDDAVVILNKPAGLLSVPVEGSDAPSALSILAAELKPRRQRALVVHRIDRFTSGLLLFAKTDADRHILIRQFLAHTPVRQYLAVVRGHVTPKSGTLVHYFRREEQFQQLSTARDRNATRAELSYLVEQSLRGATLVRATLLTGLQNQIRVQFLALGHPVVGDRKYAPAEASETKISRVALHAAHLEFIHPRTKETLVVDCDLAPDMASLVRALTPSRGDRGR